MAWTALLTVISLGIGFRFLSAELTRREEAFWRQKTRDFQRSVREQARNGDRNEEVDSSRGKTGQSRWRRALVASVKDESASCRSFMLTPTDGQPFPVFRGGQAILVGLQDPTTNKRVSRFYSLSGAPDANQYRITVKRVPGGVVSNQLHNSVHAGDEIEIQSPRGKFTWDPENPSALNLIAAGIGITPMLSMLLEFIHHRSSRPVRLYYQLRNADDAPFLERLRDFTRTLPNVVDFQLSVWWSRPNPGDAEPHDQNGRLDAESILRHTGSVEGEFLICGPEQFMSTIAEGLVGLGVKEGNVKYESFGKKSKGVGSIAVNNERVASSSDETFQVELEDQTLRWTSDCESLLELAEKNSIDVESSCREGDCGACLRRMISGKVNYANEPTCDRETDEVVMCVARPASDLRLES